MTQKIYYHPCSGQSVPDIASIITETGGSLLDARKKGNSWLSAIELRQTYGDRYDNLLWAYQPPSISMRDARRKLSKSDTGYRLTKEWILKQPGPVVVIDIMSNLENGVGPRLCELLSEDGFMYTEWRFRHRERPQASLFDIATGD